MIRSLPSNVIEPACGLTKPQIALSSVVLPAPFGPMMPVTMRGPAVSDTSSSAVKLPKLTFSPLTSRESKPTQNLSLRLYTARHCTVNAKTLMRQSLRKKARNLGAPLWLNRNQRDADPEGYPV